MKRREKIAPQPVRERLFGVYHRGQNRYQVAFTETAIENRQLKKKNKTLSASLDKAKEGSVLKRLEDAKLRQDYEAALKTLDSIPPEVIRFYENRSTQEPAMRHDK